LLLYFPLPGALGLTKKVKKQRERREKKKKNWIERLRTPAPTHQDGAAT
jgi:hypothetical protein